MNRPRFPRIFIIVIDSLGIGEMADSAAFGDTGVNTLGHISESVEEFRIPNLQKLGMANLTPLRQVPPLPQPLGYRARLNERSSSKDTMTGHWEMMGVLTTKPFRTFTETGFPPELIAELERRTGHKVIGNRSASGTVILDELGEEEIATGHMIVYTSADCVLQICGNEETFDLKELYRCCEIARELTMREEWRVGRVIARPYVGRKRGEFVRTANRHDYAVRPPRNVLSALKDAGFDVISVGKIEDIFAGEGITEGNRSKSSVHGMEQTIGTSGGCASPTWWISTRSGDTGGIRRAMLRSWSASTKSSGSCSPYLRETIFSSLPRTTAMIRPIKAATTPGRRCPSSRIRPRCRAAGNCRRRIPLR